jgi:hypothetical protein
MTWTAALNNQTFLFEKMNLFVWLGLSKETLEALIGTYVRMYIVEKNLHTLI